MATFEDVRRRKQGEEAKQRVLNRVYSSSPVQTQSTSIFDAVRNRPIEPTMSELTERFDFAKPMNIIKSAMPKTPKAEMKPLTAQQLKTGRIENLAKQKATFGTLQPIQTQPSIGQRVMGTVQDVGQFLSDFPGAFTDSATFGLSDLVARSIGGETIEEQRARNQRIGGKVGGAAGYIMPGSAIESGVSLAARPLIQNLPKAAQLATTGAASGIIEGAAQEAGDVAFRQGTFDPENVALSGALGGGLNAGLGTAIPAIQRTIANQRVGNALMKGVRNTELPATPTPGRAPNMVNNVATAENDALKQSWFTNLFGEQGLGISPVSGRGTGRMVSTQDQIVKSAIRNDVQGLKDSAAAQARATYQKFVDYLSPLKKVSNETYQTAMDASRANNLANTIARDAFVTPEGEVVGESLQSIFKKVPRGQDKNFVDYLILRHAETRMGRGERVYDESLNMTPEKVRARIETLEQRYPGFKQIAQEWDQFNDNVLKYLGVNEGLISEDLYQALREKNPFYAPMRRQFSRSEKPGRKALAKTTSSSFSGQKAPIKEVSPTGSVRKIVDPRKTTIETIGAWTNAALRNRTMQSLVDAIKRDPDGMKGIAEIVKGPNDKRNLREILLNDGIDDFVEALDNDFKAVFKTTKLSKDNVVRAMVDGQPIHIQVNDPEIVQALIGMGPQASNALIDFFGALSNATKRGATGLFAPVFAIKGATMDLVQSAIQSKNPAQQMAYTVYGILSGIADRLNIPGLRNMAQEFRRAGGEFSAALKGDRRVNRQISDMTRYPILSPKGLAQTARRTVASPFKLLESIGDIAENAPRMAAYKIEMKRLGGERTPENVRKAMEQAREITVNFSRKGSLTRDIESFVPYNNAAVQGTYRILRAFKQNPVKTMIAIAGLSVLPKLYEYTQFADDPDYQQLPARERYRFLIVSKNPDGTFVKIPMEPAYNSFGELTIEALRAFKDQDPTAFKGMADALANAWLPPAVTGALQGVTQGGGLETSIAGAINSTVAAPFVATTANQSFTGAPIVSQGLSDRSPQYQYDERTSSIAKELGKYLKMSPMKVDYLIRAYGGDPARLLLPLTSDVGAGNVRNTLLKNFIVDPQVTNTLQDDFYTAKENLTRAYRDNQEAGAELPSWYSDELRKLVTSTAKGSINKRISDYRAKIKEVSADNSLSATEKTRQLRDLRQEMNKIFIDINQRLEEAGVPLK